MRHTVFYCKSGKSPFLCGGDCNSCFSQAVRIAYECDKCGVELIYDDELNHEGETALCRNCTKKLNQKESA